MGYTVFNIMYDQDIYVSQSGNTRLLSSSYYQTAIPICDENTKVANATLLLQGCFANKGCLISLVPTELALLQSLK